MNLSPEWIFVYFHDWLISMTIIHKFYTSPILWAHLKCRSLSSVWQMLPYLHALHRIRQISYPKKKISLEKATMQKSSDSVRACKFILYKACDSSGGDFLHLKTDCKRNKQHYRAACERAYYWCDKPPEQIRLTVNEMVFWAWTRDEWA